MVFPDVSWGMNIGIFTNNYKPRASGVPISIETFANGLRRMGHRVYIFAPFIRGYRDDDEDVFRLPSIPSLGDRTLALPIPWWGWLYSIAKDLHLDIIHSQHPFLLGRLGARLARKSGIPLVFTHHTRYEEYVHYIPFPKRITRRIAIHLVTSYANRCDLVIVPTEGIREILLRNGVKTRIEKVPTGIELEDFDGIQKGVIRNLYGIDDDTKILLYVGRIAKEKNLSFLVMAFKEIVKRIPSTIMIILGYGPFEKEIKDLVNRVGLKGNVIFSKALSRRDVYHYYIDAQIFLFSSLTETQGLVLYEALGAGLPIVAIDAIGTREIVKDGFNGYLTTEDPHRFSQYVIELLMDDEKRKRFSMASKEIAKGFSSKLQTQRLILLYKELLRY